MSYIEPDWNLKGITTRFSTTDMSTHERSGHQIISHDMGINTNTPHDITSRNRSAFIHDAGLHPENFAFVKQVHGNKVVYANHKGLLTEADGLVTNVPGLAIGVLVADCAAILAADVKNRVIGAFHAGWRGAVTGIIGNGIQEMLSHGSHVSDIHIWVSPCIGKDFFEVGEEVAERFPAEFVYRHGYGKPHIDLKSFINSELIKHGIDRERIIINPLCTYNDESLFSFRRQKEKSGRMLGLIALH